MRPTGADPDASAGHRSTSGGGPLFGDDFLGWFADLDFFGTHRGRRARRPSGPPNTPITVVEGPLAAAQLLESPLLNRLNFPTLIATKASRVTEAALGRPVLEFGMRRAAERGADAATRRPGRRRQLHLEHRRRVRRRD